MEDKLTVINKSPATRTAFCNATVGFEENIGLAYIELGRRLLLIRDERLYADQWDTFEEYVQEFRNISASTASKLITIYDVFVYQYKFTAKKLAAVRGWTLLAEIASIVTTREEAMDWVHKAATLTRSHLRAEVTEAKTGKLQKDCKHKNVAYLMVCVDGCGFKERVNELPKDIKKRLPAPKQK